MGILKGVAIENKKKWWGCIKNVKKNWRKGE